VDQELKAYLEEMEARMEARAEGRESRMNERFAGLESRMDERIAGMDERLGRVETEGRRTRVLLEGMHDNIRLLGEGVMGVTERLEAFQGEVAGHFAEIKASLSPVYQNLSGRVHSIDDQVQYLDGRVRSVDSRVRVLEAKADRQTEDVLESIRKKFGKPQA
jgi:chromosome segregation ATPase